MQSLSELVQQAESEIAGAADLAALDAVRVRYLGKKGELTARLKGLSGLSAEERPAAGQEINKAKKKSLKSDFTTSARALETALAAVLSSNRRILSRENQPCGES